MINPTALKYHCALCSQRGRKVVRHDIEAFDLNPMTRKPKESCRRSIAERKNGSTPFRIGHFVSDKPPSERTEAQARAKEVRRRIEDLRDAARLRDEIVGDTW